MADAFLLPPSCTVTQAEIRAAFRLLSGLQEFALVGTRPAGLTAADWSDRKPQKPRFTVYRRLP
eukprot:3025410-Pyramimonas_sp.AAC.1